MSTLETSAGGEELSTTPVPTSNPSTSSAGGSPARTSPTPDGGAAWPASGRACGGSSPAWFARWDPATCCWKTSQLCLDGELTPFSGRWPRAGTMRGGTAYRLPPSVPLTAVTGSSSWPTSLGDGDRTTDYAQGGRSLGRAVRTWPTPTASDYKGANPLTRPPGDDDLPTRLVRQWATPTARDHRSTRGSDATWEKNSRPLSEQVGHAESGKQTPPTSRQYPTPTANRRSGLQSHGVNVITETLNPAWVEWLMGFPIGWTDCEDSATR